MEIPWTLDAGLLFLLAVPVVMKYRILPVEGTPYWLFGILFLLLTFNIFISVFSHSLFKKFAIGKVKIIITGLVLAIVVGGVTVTAIVDRHNVAPVYGVNDIVLQQEAAIRYLVHGKNPYKETYFGTPVESFQYAEVGQSATVNPALYHFVMPPWYRISPFFFYTPANKLFGFFDGRMMLIFCLLGTLLILGKLIKNDKIKLIAINLVALAPGVIDYFIEGRSDIFALFWFIWAVYLLARKKFIFASVIFGLAMISKQTVWFALPFYIVALWKMNKDSVKTAFYHLLIVGGVAMIFTVPFLVWDFRAFIDSVILYVSGGTAHGYPIAGYGFGMILYEFGIIRDLHGNFPFIIFQLGIGIPVMLAALWLFIKKPTISNMLYGYAFTLLAVWYFSRYLNNSHLAYVGTLFIIAILKNWDEKLLA